MALEITASAVTQLQEKLSRLKGEIQKVIVGQDNILDEILVALLAGGHCLLEGVPGLAKTLMVRTLSQALHLNFRRIQFTPDLMPTDIIGTEILEEDHVTGKRFFKFNKGPLFSNIVLADEINRTPPKTQSALLEAMQEFEITYGGQTYPLDRPFFILATQNPIEQAGTYPLPEAQLDRFLLYIRIGYPTAQEEADILRNTTGTKKPKVEPVVNGEDILQLQGLVREVTINDDLIQYVAELIRATRPDTSTVSYVKEWVRWGAGPRAGQALILTAKARALFKGRYAVTMDDIKAMAYPVLRHRVLLNFKAEAERISTDDVTRELLQAVARVKGLI
ncbi:MoxR-like ATPase [Filimonas zeae]|uniref:ATPase AAA n=1 Tax=Filimonas zeae TaxID=1737353 RepID=A0A917J571_9BACT|nr:MoxR family ATPase [Filimonas zeae]MDR6340790.1 MoxR-like ATPase [Filimonas zeae]GGH78444.1 ATPase AAA [Filimonas zeae]